MNFGQFVETLTKMDIPWDARVVIKKDLISDMNEIETIEYDPKNHIVYLREVFTFYDKEE